MDTFAFTCAGGRMMPYLAAWLKRDRPDLLLLGFDANPEVERSGVVGFDEVRALPRPSEVDYVDRLIDAIRPYGPCTLVAGSDEEALLLAKVQDEVRSAGGRVAFSHHEDLLSASNKLTLFEILNSTSQCQLAETLAAGTPEQAREVIEQLGGPDRPVVLKPAVGRGRRGVYVISNAALPVHDDLPPVINLEDIETIYQSEVPPDLAMPYITGKAVTVDLLAVSGRPVQIVVRKWLENWRFPFPGQVVCRDPQIEELATKIAEQFELHGLVDIDLIAPETGPPAILEVNPRPSGSSVVALAAGIPLFAQYAHVAVGKIPETIAVPDRVVSLEDLQSTNG